MDIDINRMSELGIDVDEGIGYTGSIDQYINALLMYYESFDDNVSLLSEYYDSNDIDNYAIKTHALKSNSRLIGALHLAGEFEKLEKAAKNSELDIISANHQAVLKLYEDTRGGLQSIYEEHIKSEPVLGTDEILVKLDELIEALNDFDDDKALIIIDEIKPSMAGENRLQDVYNYVLEFMYDEAIDIINDIKESQ